MELKDFVQATLVQIVEGVVGAQCATKDLHATVAPQILGNHVEATKLGLAAVGGEYAQLVQFDVALTATQGTGTKGGLGVVVGAFTLGSTGESKAGHETASRVKFMVPLTLPAPHHVS